MPNNTPILAIKPTRASGSKLATYAGEYGHLAIDTDTNELCFFSGTVGRLYRFPKDTVATEEIKGLMSAEDKTVVDMLFDQMAILTAKVEQLTNLLYENRFCLTSNGSDKQTGQENNND